MPHADPEKRRQATRESMRRKRAAERAKREAAAGGQAAVPAARQVVGSRPPAPPPPPPEPLEPDGEVAAADDVNLARTLWRRIVKDPTAGETNRIRAAYHLEQSRKSGSEPPPATPALDDGMVM